MIDKIENVVVLGASGTIGSLTGGLIAQQGIKVYFLSRTQEGSERGMKRAFDQARSEVIGKNIVCGDYENMLEEAVDKADLIIESITENLEIKKTIYRRIDEIRKTDTIVGSTTSSLPLDSLVEGRSESLKQHFMSTHFYNPPGKMLACEIAAINETLPEIYEFIEKFLAKGLRRVVIPTKNIAGFAGNRIAFLLFNRITTLAQAYGVEVMDYLIGPYTGRMMAPLATIDLVGIDIHKAIINSLYENTHDDMHHSLVLPDYVNKMIDNGCLGNKTPDMGGFRKRLLSGKYLYIDPENCEYIPAVGPHVIIVEKTKQLIHVGLYRQAFDIIMSSSVREVEIIKDILCTYISYSFSLIGEVTDHEYGIQGIDKVMSYGFHWASPSLVVDILGGRERVIELLQKKGFKVPETLLNYESENTIHNLGKYFPAR